MKNEAVLNQFIIEVSLIDPIQKIVNQLEGHYFRDCDIKWLDAKLEGFIKLAAETLFINVPAQVEREKFVRFNEYVQAHYTERFTTLLDYFKSY